jgi:hypothetical protein
VAALWRERLAQPALSPASKRIDSAPCAFGARLGDQWQSCGRAGAANVDPRRQRALIHKQKAAANGLFINDLREF